MQDTQCGFKLFRGDAADELFKAQTLLGWAFDIELLYIAKKWGYQIEELGIDWYFADLSHVSPLRDTVRLFLDIINMRWKALKGEYGKKV